MIIETPEMITGNNHPSATTTQILPDFARR